MLPPPRGFLRRVLPLALVVGGSLLCFWRSLRATDHGEINITRVGAVGKPGTYELPSANQDVLAAPIAASGLTGKATTIVETRNLESSRAREAFYNGEGSTLVQDDALRIDLVEARADRVPEYRIQDGSIVAVSIEETPLPFTVGTIQDFVRFGFSATIPGL